jgi:hypothetical protein
MLTFYLQNMRLRFVILFLVVSNGAAAQLDTNYCRPYSDWITGRFYFSQKYTRLSMKNDDDKYDLGYRPNTTLNMGVGATYQWATLNLAYGFPFLNREDGKGDTRYLDLQAHFYGPKFVTDLFGQFYRGFYLYPRGTYSTPELYYVRPDLKVNALGASVQYVFNNKKFSYRAAFVQSEWQTKSCGSLIAGAEFHFGRLFADSSVIPSVIGSNKEIDNIRRFDYLELGPSVGYTYTLVVKKHFFLTGSLAFSFDYIINSSHGNASVIRSNGFSPNTTFRMFAGYNSALNAVSLTFTNADVSLSTQRSATEIRLSTGNFRINYVRRFKPGPKPMRYLRYLDK